MSGMGAMPAQVCCICGLGPKPGEPIYAFAGMMRRLGREPGPAHVDCIRKERGRVDAERQRRERGAP